MGSVSQRNAIVHWVVVCFMLRRLNKLTPPHKKTPCGDAIDLPHRPFAGAC